jgi:hypothetical protein
MARAAPDAEDEEAATALAYLDQTACHGVELLRVDGRGKRRDGL